MNILAKLAFWTLLGGLLCGRGLVAETRARSGRLDLDDDERPARHVGKRQAWAARNRYFDEVYDMTSRGRAVRPHYVAALAIFQKLSPARRAEIEEALTADFKKDNAVTVLPRILTRAEDAHLKAGVAQRAAALRAFLQDHYSGERRYRDHLIPGAVIDRILQRTGDDQFEGGIDPERIAFPYGPDLVRDEEGIWRVIEDNPGWIGGPGDLALARSALLNRIPEYASLPIVDDPMDYYREMVKRAKALARPPGGQIVLYQMPPYPDNEDHRLKKLYAKEGVVVVTPNTKKRLVTTEEGAFIEEDGPGGTKTRTRVGYLIFNGEHATLDWKHPAGRKRALIDEAKSHLQIADAGPIAKALIRKALEGDESGKVDPAEVENALRRSRYRSDVSTRRKVLVPGLLEAMLSGKVVTNYSPGLDFIGDKALYPYVEEMVRFYLGEEPLLRNIESGTFTRTGANGQEIVDSAEIKKVEGAWLGHVIKPFDGRGGAGVKVGPNLLHEDFLEVMRRVRRSPQRFLWQKYVAPSRMQDLIVDLRAIAQVYPTGDVFLSPSYWGRAVSKDGDGRMNVSANGKETPVFVLEGGPDCRFDLLKDSTQVGAHLPGRTGP